MNFAIPVRVTQAKRCREGFYVLINGERIRKATRKLALAEVRGFLALQKIQIVSVREYVERNRKRIQRQMEAA